MWEIQKIVKKGDYCYAVVPDHPNAIKHGYVLLHRVIMENHLGRLLDKNEIVHHINHDKKDNRVENLQIMINVEHNRKHGLEQGRKFCLVKCPNCKKEWEHPYNNTHLVKKGIFTSCSTKCRGKFSALIQYQGITHEVETAISGNILSTYRKYAEDYPEQTN